MSLKQWQATLDQGCEWCGTKFPAINKPTVGGLKTYGLHEAHIFAKKYAPIETWNTFLLCPNCHTIFDRVIKPRLQEAVKTALRGFEDPSGSGESFVVAQTSDELLERLIAKDNDKAPPGLQPAAKLPEWHTRRRGKSAMAKAAGPTKAREVSK